jgi:leucyl aminopeptidase (aminopeptidase T)/HD-GYP domain-containing protein (c-di-GMP phosphodiesterase class II)
MGVSVDAIKEAERTRSSRAQRGRPLPLALRRGELFVSAGFMVAALALPRVGASPGNVSLGTAALYVAGIAVASQVRFDVGAGFTVPTQAVFVPMLFALPVSVVPLLIPPALALGMAPRIIRREVSASWLLTAIGNSWFALGPAFVLRLADVHSPDGRWGILLLALGAQFVCDFAASAVRERLFGDLDLRSLLHEVEPIYAIDAGLALVGLAVALAATEAHSQLPAVLIAPLFLILRFFSRERRERLDQLTELSDAYQGTALLLGDVVEADDAYTGEHSKGVVRLALDVAKKLDLDADSRRNVEFAALLHDVGKIAVPKEIINKPGKLTEREWAIVKTHTIEGQRMLDKIGGLMREVGGIVRASHEQWDGSGYPDGLRGEAIPVEARIVCACDAFNAMTTTRSYRSAMPLPDAIAELTRCAGSQFDPEVVDALVSVVSASAVERVESAEPSEFRASDLPLAVPVAEHQVSDPLPSPAAVPTPAPQAAVANSELGEPTAAGGFGDLHTTPAQVIERLADLVVTVGANVQVGQDVEVSGEIGHLEMIRAIVAAAYRRGARFVDARIADPILQHTHISAAPEDAVGHVPRWEEVRVLDLAQCNGASILITGPTFPTLFDGLDPGKVAEAEIGPSAQWREAERTISWTVVPAATPGWAKQLRPHLGSDEALAALWRDLARACRLDEPDPTAAWRARLATLRQRAEWLTALELDVVHLEGPGTDLTIGLQAGVRWQCPQATTPQGIEFLPNLPTEEVFTTPDPARAQGYVLLTRPVPIGGRLIDNVRLRFEDGRVVDISGPPEVSALWEFTARDDGAERLGELALVDRECRVARLEQTFGETLLDENAASHIALGRGFVHLLPDANVQGVNVSDHHLDVMFGSPHVDVTGTDRRGATHPLLRDGHWAGPPEPSPSRARRTLPRGRAGRVSHGADQSLLRDGV